MGGLGSGLGQAAALTVDPIGDSITQGVGCSPADAAFNAGYRWLLCLAARARGINIMMVGTQAARGDAAVTQIGHDGVPGETIANIGTRIRSRFALACPEVGIVIAGTNDAVAGTPAATSLTALDGLISDAFAYGSRPGANTLKLFLVAQIPHCIATGGSDAIVVAYNQGIPALCAAHRAAGRNAMPVDLMTPLGPAGSAQFFGGDPTHPNAAGYGLMPTAFLGTPGSGLLADYGR